MSSIEEKVDKYLKKVYSVSEEIGWENLPKGWDKKSVEKFANSLTKDSGLSPDDEGWFDACVEKIEGELDDPEAFCASLRDHVKGTTYWRGDSEEKGD